jgi:hypothetical protein
MAKIDTREKLIGYIKRRLGEPVITVELTEEQIDDIIDEVVLKYSEFAVDGQEKRAMIIPLFNQINEYKLDNRIASILDLRVERRNTSVSMAGLYSIPPGYTPTISNAGQMSLGDFETTLANISRVNTLFDVRPNFNFNSNNKVIHFLENIAGYGSALIEVALEYEPGEVDLIFNHPWIKDMCVAQSKYQWGNNIGKYSGTLINGNTINYSDIKSDAQSDIERLDGELLSRWSPPLGITVG